MNNELVSDVILALRHLAADPVACAPSGSDGLRLAAGGALAALGHSLNVGLRRLPRDAPERVAFQRACAQMSLVRHGTEPAECREWADEWEEAIRAPAADSSSHWYHAGVEDALATGFSAADDMSGAHLGTDAQAVTDWRAGVEYVRALGPWGRKALAGIDAFDRMVPAARAALFAALPGVTDETTLRATMAQLGRSET